MDIILISLLVRVSGPIAVKRNSFCVTLLWVSTVGLLVSLTVVQLDWVFDLFFSYWS